jgi:small subunit ribosomal protein S1
VDLEAAAHVREFVGREIEAEVIKIDSERMNVIVARRLLLERRTGEGGDGGD